MGVGKFSSGMGIKQCGMRVFDIKVQTKRWPAVVKKDALHICGKMWKSRVERGAVVVKVDWFDAQYFLVVRFLCTFYETDAEPSSKTHFVLEKMKAYFWIDYSFKIKIQVYLWISYFDRNFMVSFSVLFSFFFTSAYQTQSIKPHRISARTSHGGWQPKCHTFFCSWIDCSGCVSHGSGSFV